MRKVDFPRAARYCIYVFIKFPARLNSEFVIFLQRDICDMKFHFRQRNVSRLPLPDYPMMENKFFNINNDNMSCCDK